jgi:DNA (cytosine-5)-methyltransferase 1
VRRDLHMLGYRTRAFALAAADVGAPHLRRRVFVVAADPERLELRDERRWRGGPNGQGPAEPRDDGQEGNVADADRVPGDVREGARADLPVPPDGGWWATEPAVGRVADGVPGRLDRLRMLGNSVVPQCAEAIGRLILEMTTPCARKEGQ